MDLAGWLFDALLLALCFYVVKTWFRWFRSEVRFVDPKWRSRITVVGFATSNVSVTIIIALMIHDAIGSGFQPYHPILMRALLVVMATAVLVIIAALIGRGPLGFPTAVCSVFCLLIVVAHGLAS
jgi:hypothetical protein